MNIIYKKESTVIFGCIIIILLFYSICFIFDKSKTYTENFGNNNSKRNKMIKIYKDSDIIDPNEIPDMNPNYDDDNNDPDSNYAYDPDSNIYTIDSYDIDSNRNKNKNKNNTINSTITNIYDPYKSIGYDYMPYSSITKYSYL